MRTARLAALALALALGVAACHGRDAIDDSFATIVLDPPLCAYEPDGGVRDPATLDKLRTRGSCAADAECSSAFGLGARCINDDGGGVHCIKVCSVDGDCPYGSYCDLAGGICTFDCDGASTGKYVCAANQSCDGSGHCGAACPPVGSEPALSVAPAGLTLPVPTGAPQPNRLGRADVTLTAPTLAVAQRSGAIAVNLAADAGTLVSCDPQADTDNAPLSGSCTLSRWTFTVAADGLNYVARNRVFIGLSPQSGRLPDPAFSVNFSAEQVEHARLSVAVRPLRPSVKPGTFADGKYLGQLILKSDQTQGVHRGDAVLPVTAYAQNGHLVVVDPSGSVSPTGRVHLSNQTLLFNTDYVDTWFTAGSLSGATGDLRVRVVPTQTLQQSAVGEVLTGGFRIVPPAPQSSAVDYQVQLQPVGALDSCDATHACAAGTTCGDGHLCTPEAAPSSLGKTTVNTLVHDDAARWQTALSGLLSNASNWTDGGQVFATAPAVRATTSTGLYVFNDLYAKAHPSNRDNPTHGELPDDSPLLGWGQGGPQFSPTMGYDLCLRDIGRLLGGSFPNPSWTIDTRTTALDNGCWPADDGLHGPFASQSDGYWAPIPSAICDKFYTIVDQIFLSGGRGCTSDSDCPSGAWCDMRDANDACSFGSTCQPFDQDVLNVRKAQRMGSLAPCFVAGNASAAQLSVNSGSCQNFLDHAVAAGQVPPMSLQQYRKSYCVEAEETVTWPAYNSQVPVALCPWQHLLGPVGGSGAAERLACYDPLRPIFSCNITSDCPAAQSCIDHGCVADAPQETIFETTRLGTVTLPTSGDLRCDSDPRLPKMTNGATQATPMPMTFEIFNQRDRALELGSAHTMKYEDMLRECMNDLSIVPAAVTQNGSPQSTMASLFARRSCVSLARLYPALRNGGAAPGRYWARLVQQWLEVHSFVAQQGMRQWWLDRVINDGNVDQNGPAPAPADAVAPLVPLVDRVDRGYALLLDDTVLSSIEKLTPAELFDPDYRKDHVPGLVDTSIDHDQRDGLPVALLDGMGAYFELLEMYAKRVSVATYDSCRSGAPSTTRAQALTRIGASLRAATTLTALAEELHTRALTAGTPPWATRWTTVRALFVDKRARLYGVLRDLESCSSSLGVDGSSAPLYFEDSLDPIARAFPAAYYMLNKWAQPKVSGALAALASARTAWLSHRSSEVQQAISDMERALRIQQVKEKYGAPLKLVCGPPDANATDATMLDYFTAANGRAALTPENCYEVTGCDNSGSTPNPKCLRGQLGEAALAIEAARQDIALAQASWQDAQHRLDAQTNQCDNLMHEKQTDNNLIQQHDWVMQRRREELRDSQIMSGIVDGVAGLFKSVASEDAFGAMFTVYDTGFKLQQVALQSEADNADRAWNAFMAARLNDQQVESCRWEEDKVSIGIATLEKTVARRSTDFDLAQLRFRNLLDQTRHLVREGQQAVAIEQSRGVLSIAHSYWFDEELQSFATAFDVAQRMSFLATQAVEYEKQADSGQRSTILQATHPNQLRDAVTQLELQLGSNQIDGLRLTPDSIVVGLLDPTPGGQAGLLGLADHSGQGGRPYDQKQRLRDLLLSPSNAIFDARGQYVGQGIPISMTPAAWGLNGASLSNFCGERLIRVTGMIALGGQSLNGGPVPVQLRKRNTFATQQCNHLAGDAHEQTASIVPWIDPFVGEQGPPRRAADWYSPIDLQLDWKGSYTDLYVPGYPGYFSTQASDMGLYGDYLLVFPWDHLLQAGFRLDQVDNVYLRFDFIRADDSPIGSVRTKRVIAKVH